MRQGRVIDVALTRIHNEITRFQCVNYAEEEDTGQNSAEHNGVTTRSLKRGLTRP